MRPRAGNPPPGRRRSAWGPAARGRFAWRWRRRSVACADGSGSYVERGTDRPSIVVALGVRHKTRGAGFAGPSGDGIERPPRILSSGRGWRNRPFRGEIGAKHHQEEQGEVEKDERPTLVEIPELARDQ